MAAALLAATLLGSASTACTASHADPDTTTTTATVLRIVDGDTVDVVDDTRGRLRIRLLGIDTPETKKPGYTVGCGGSTEPDRQTPMWGRGRIDHFGLQAASQEAFDTICQRLVEHHASDGTVNDFGSAYSIFFRDPDGLEGEVLVAKG